MSRCDLLLRLRHDACALHNWQACFFTSCNSILIVRCKPLASCKCKRVLNHLHCSVWHVRTATSMFHVCGTDSAATRLNTNAILCDVLAPLPSMATGVLQLPLR
jgi:hypothetical protein